MPFDNVAVIVTVLEESSSIAAALLDNVTVGALSLSVIVIVTDCDPLSVALPPETPLTAIVAVSLDVAS